MLLFSDYSSVYLQHVSKITCLISYTEFRMMNVQQHQMMGRDVLSGFLETYCITVHSCFLQLIPPPPSKKIYGSAIG
jgi:hypothetical protein